MLRRRFSILAPVLAFAALWGLNAGAGEIKPCKASDCPCCPACCSTCCPACMPVCYSPNRQAKSERIDPLTTRRAALQNVYGAPASCCVVCPCPVCCGVI
jgi:hypothetical protein